MRAWWWGIIAASVVTLLYARRASADEIPPPKVVTMNGAPVPRGIRNNNPGNLRPSRKSEPWRGQASVDDANYLIFIDAHHGLRALVINLVNQQRKHGLRTVRAIITKYAPSTENDTAAYIAAVSRALDVGPDDPLDLVSNRAQLEALTRAVIKHENGLQPYGTAALGDAINAALAQA